MARYTTQYDSCGSVTPVQGYRACNGDMFVKLEDALSSSIASNYNKSLIGTYRLITRHEVLELIESSPRLVLELAETILDKKRQDALDTLKREGIE